MDDENKWLRIRGLEVADQGLAILEAEAAGAAGLVHPVLPSAERAVPAERGAAVPALGRLASAPCPIPSAIGSVPISAAIVVIMIGRNRTMHAL